MAGEAVRSQLSPDGTTLAVITAGQNSLYKPDGTVDTANSTNTLPVRRHRSEPGNPALKQVIQQMNAHVGLAFSPDGKTLDAAGGNDYAVYVIDEERRHFAPATPIASEPFPAGCHRQRPEHRLGLECSPTRAAWTSRPTANARRGQQLQRFDQRDRYRYACTSASSTICGRSLPAMRIATARAGGTFPYLRGDERETAPPMCRRTAIAK